MSSAPGANSGVEEESGDARRRRIHFEEFRIPQIGTSLVTGLTGAPVWGSINKSGTASRWAIGEGDCDDLSNYLPMGAYQTQIPSNGTTITTLASPIIWQTEIFLNSSLLILSMCQNGHLYQTTLGGATTDIYSAGQTSQSGSCTNGSAIITGLNTSTLSVGMGITATGFAGGTTIASVDSGTQIHASNNFTGTTGSVTLNFTTPLFTTSGIVDAAVWQSTVLLISDSAAQKVYSWNGTNLLIVFNAQPVSYIAVFSQRLWMGNNLTIEWTNISTYNSLAGDSGSYLITDYNCINPINCMFDSPYGLFVSGSNWFKFITNLQDVTVATVSALTFQQNTIEAQVGPLSKWATLVIGNVIFFANTAGVWAINGGQPSQISQPFLDGFFSNLDYTKTSLSMAYGLINSVPCLFVQAYYKGDTQVSAGYTVFGYTIQSLQWFRYVQGTIAWISGSVSTAVANNNPTIWGCDGTNIFQMFANTTSTQLSQCNTKLWDFGSMLDIDLILNVAVEILATAGATVTVTQLDETNIARRTTSETLTSPGAITILNNAGNQINILNNSLALITILGISAANYQLFQDDGCGRVRRVGLNIAISSVGASLIGLVISYHRTETGRGS